MNHYVSLALTNRKSSVHLHALYSPRTALRMFTPRRNHLMVCLLYGRQRLVGSHGCGSHLSQFIYVYVNLSSPPVILSIFGITSLYEPQPSLEVKAACYVFLFPDNSIFTGWGCKSHAQPPTWRTRPPYLCPPETG
jgi:hypothetical protein